MPIRVIGAYRFKDWIEGLWEVEFSVKGQRKIRPVKNFAAALHCAKMKCLWTLSTCEGVEMFRVFGERAKVCDNCLSEYDSGEKLITWQNRYRFCKTCYEHNYKE